MGFTLKQYVFICGMLITGTINTISKKMQLDCEAPGYYNHSANNTQTVHKFNKPWFQTLLMFIGEALCIFVFLILRFRKRKQLLNAEVFERFDSQSAGRGLAHAPLCNWYFLLPSCCDLLGTTLAGIGLMFIDASIWQMMRGSLIIFAGILSVIFLKRRLRCFHWTGMSITVIGLALVGSKSVFNSESSKSNGAQAALGVGLVLAGALSTASQMIVEEVFLKRRGFHPLQAVGMEGIFGCLLMIIIALPAVHFIPGSDLNGSYENFIDALYQIKSSTVLLVNTFLYILSIAFYNYFGLSITRTLSAIHRTLIDALRTAFVWVISVIFHYAISSRFGEAITLGWGLIEIDGFAFLIIGTLIYNKVMDLSFLPCCVDPIEEPVSTLATIEENFESDAPIISSSSAFNIRSNNDDEYNNRNQTTNNDNNNNLKATIVNGKQTSYSSIEDSNQ